MPAIFQYPDDLGTDPSLQHYVAFMINVRLTGTQQMPGTNATGTIVTPGGAGGENASNTGVRNVGAGAVNSLQYAGVTRGVTGSNQLVRLDAVIALHLPDAPETSYKAQYNNTDLGAAGFLANQFAGKSDGAGLAQQGVEFLGKGGATIASTIAKGVSAPGTFSAFTKVRLNPYQQTFFDQMDFRHHVFRYKFMPKNEQEALVVKRICDLFKFHMHPQLAAETFFMIFPSEFDIMFFYGASENGYWHRITSCVLINMNIRYGGEHFASFAGGIPSEVNLDLEFRETEVLTKERILRGY